MNRKKIITALLVVHVLGCGGPPATRYYVLHLNSKPSAPASQISVGISEFNIEPVFANYKIAYRESPYQIQFYHYHQWAADPARIVQDGIMDFLTQSGKFKRVVRLPSRENVDIAVGGHIHKLEEWDESDRWYGIVEMEFELTDRRSDQPIWKGSMSRKIPADNKDPLAVVRALSRATEEIAAELSQKILTASQIAEKGN